MKHQLSFLLLVICNAAFIFARQTEKNDFSSKNSSNTVHYEYVLLDDVHPCSRKCIYNAPPMICRYHFKIENYFTLTKACHDCPRNRTDCFRKDCIPGDGHERALVSVNRKVPGPSIEVCQNDMVVVDVENHMMSEGTTIHWHGQHQKDSPYMDGVPYVTQCPILPRTTFRYSFKAAQAGTHFWHSHLGMQRVDGCYGPLIVRVPEENDPHYPLYDYDLSPHTIMIIDWERISGMEKFLYHHHSVGDNKPATLLINGMGRHRTFYESENRTYSTPLARYSVEQGYRYRFRVINAGFLNCPVEVSIDNHTITLISTDGSDVVPVEADSLVTYAGERFDFILSADQPKSLYWIRFRGLMDCDERYRSAYQVAVLAYKEFSSTEINRDENDENPQNFDVTTNSISENETELSNEVAITSPSRDIPTVNALNIFANLDEEILPDGIPDYDNSHRGGKQINSLNKGTEANNSHVSMPELSSLQKWDRSLKSKPDYQIFLAYDFYNLDNKHFHGDGYEFYNVTPNTNRLLTPQLNHISMEFPSFPLLPQRDEIPPNMFCNENTIKGQDCANTYCECPHAYQVPLDSVVELVIIDEGFAFDANHPLHLHGYAFRVIAMEKVGENVTVEQVKQKDRKGLIKRNLLDPPIKDTVTVPDGGYTIVRFQATNPGYWIFHCHLEFHAEIGMALVFKVGDDKQMQPVPQGFPRCGNYLPTETIESENNTKPICSKNSFINKFEKVLFGDYCQDVPSASITLRNNKLAIFMSLFMLFFKMMIN